MKTFIITQYILRRYIQGRIWLEGVMNFIRCSDKDAIYISVYEEGRNIIYQCKDSKLKKICEEITKNKIKKWEIGRIDGKRDRSYA